MATTTDPWLSRLNPAQREAVEHVSGPLLVLAGAGSGKTRVLTVRIARLIEEHGVSPGHIFAVTFTNKAAGEMKERVGRLLGRDPGGLWIGTFHSLSARMLRREAPLIGFTHQYTIYDEDDRQSLIRRLMDEQGHSTKLFNPRAISSIISSAKNRMQGPDDLLRDSPFDKLVATAAAVYEDLGPALRKANAMDFDDLLLHPLRLFREHPDRLAWYQRRFKFLMVDEFQDTNGAQYQFVTQLATEHRNVFVVGDDDQSIYGWRGADVRNMNRFQEDFPGTRVVRLEENYRSTSIILNAANGVITENSGRMGKTLRTVRQGGERVTLIACADERDEAEWIIRELSNRRARGDAEWKDVAILYRTNSQSRALEEALRRAAVPYRLVGAISFYDRREVKDLLAYLRLTANPKDDQAFLRVIGVPRRGIGETTLATVSEQAALWGRPLLETAGIADRITGLRPNVRSALVNFAGTMEQIRARSSSASPARVIEDVIETIAYEKVLEEEGPEGVERWENVRELLASAADWSEVATDDEEELPGTPLERFLAEAALLTSTDNVTGDQEGVTLMTFHTAKGLEWPVVIMSGMEEGLFPLARSMEQPEGVEEERRLCYVGLTRAKSKLYLSWARSRRRGGEMRPGRASRFLAALPPGDVDEVRTSSLWSLPSRPDWRRAGSRSGRSSGAFGSDGGRFAEAGSAGKAEVPVEDISQDSPRYVKGERVRHRRFGSGTVEGLKGAGRDLKVVVQFDDDEAGQKELLVAYAGLERDWEGA